MKNIHEILRAFGLEIPSDKKTEFEKVVIENYKTVAEVEKINDKLSEATQELKNSKETISQLTAEAEKLKTDGASAEEWKTKFENLQNEIEQKEAAAKTEREKAEREADIKARFNAVSIDKDGKPLEWAHEAIRADYLKKFGEIISDVDNAEYKGKSDSEILYSLRKDDATAIKTVTPEVNLKGAEPIGGTDARTNTLMSAMGLSKGKEE